MEACNHDIEKLNKGAGGMIHLIDNQTSNRRTKRPIVKVNPIESSNN